MGQTAPALVVFLSYRREDTAGYAGRLYDALTARFGDDHVFMDVDKIDLGVDFTKEIDKRVQSCDVLIALVGRRWLAAADDEGERRLDNPQGFVRLEVEAALERDVRVIPALVDGARVPKARDLPNSLKQFAVRNGIALRHEAWRSDVNKLIEALDRIATEKSKQQEPKPTAKSTSVHEEIPDASEGRDVRLPRLGHGMESGVIHKWLWFVPLEPSVEVSSGEYLGQRSRKIRQLRSKSMF